MNKYVAKLKNKLVEVRGEKLYELKILGIQLYLVTKTNEYHTNFYILFLPILRIENEPHRFAINILVFVWFYKICKLLFTRWEFQRTAKGWEIRFLNKRLISYIKSVPFQFPSAQFKN